MKVKQLLERIFFGTRVKGEPIGKGTTTLSISKLEPRPSEKEWKKEFKVSSQYSRFNPTGQWYGDETPTEYNNILKAVLTGSI